MANHSDLKKRNETVIFLNKNRKSVLKIIFRCFIVMQKNKPSEWMSFWNKAGHRDYFKMYVLLMISLYLSLSITL